MRRILSFLGKNLLVLGLVSFVSLSGAFFFAQPGNAAVASMQEHRIDSSNAGQSQEQNYEQLAKEARDTVNNPQALDEEYDREQKASKQGQGGFVEGAKKALEKVTNADQ
ncbi:MAG: hypothetical protein ACAF41_17565 [Leptolyngbya sp. BL-A-14]